MTLVILSYITIYYVLVVTIFEQYSMCSTIGIICSCVSRLVLCYVNSITCAVQLVGCDEILRVRANDTHIITCINPT